MPEQLELWMIILQHEIQNSEQLLVGSKFPILSALVEMVIFANILHIIEFERFN